MIVNHRLVWQELGEPLGVVLEQLTGVSNYDVTDGQLVHAINLYTRDGEVPLEQQLVLKTIAKAQASSSTSSTLLPVVAPVDATAVLDAIRTAGVSDVAEPAALNRYVGTRPRLFDVFDALEPRLEPTDRVIFSNADIGLAAAFYDGISSLTGAGAEAMVINRRSIFGIGPGSPFADLAEFDVGSPHPGFDCFVFPAEVLPKLHASDAIVGAPYVMQSLLLNLVATMNPLLVLTNVVLTHHFGDDRGWAENEEDRARNILAARTVQRTIEAEGGRVEDFLEAFPQWNPSALLI